MDGLQAVYCVLTLTLWIVFLVFRQTSKIREKNPSAHLNSEPSPIPPCPRL